MIRLRFISMILCTICAFTARSQVRVLGYVFAENNRGFLNEVQVNAHDKLGRVASDAFSNRDGEFEMMLNPGVYQFTFEKGGFESKDTTVTILADQSNYLSIKLIRKPGYIFEATLAPVRTSDTIPVDAIAGALVEVYNNTTDSLELEAPNIPSYTFHHTLEQGNHYTILIQKEGYLAKKIDAYVNVKGCILCIDGVKQLTPGVTDNLTAGHQMGTLLANIEMQPISKKIALPIRDVHFESGSASLTSESTEQLDEVVDLLKINPGLTFELSAHTDSRASDESNLKLSQKRARAVKSYLVTYSGINPAQLTTQGYGETRLKNHCKDGVPCTDEEHAVNRRVELRYTGRLVNPNGEPEIFTLKKYAEDRKMEKLLEEVLNSDVYDPTANAVDTVATPADTVDIEIIREIKDKRIPKEAPQKVPQEEINGTSPAQTSMAATAPQTNPAPREKHLIIEPVIRQKNTSSVPSTQPKPSRQEVPIITSAQVVTTTKNVMTTGETALSDLVVYYKPRVVPTNLDGYTVQVLKSKDLLPDDNPLFKNNQDVYYLINVKNGLIYYYKGYFDNFEECKASKLTLLKDYPEATMVLFVDGKPRK